MVLRDIWHVYILGKHKHYYKRIEDGSVNIQTCKDGLLGIKYQRHQCPLCKKIVGLDDWQIKDLPTEMLYERICRKTCKTDDGMIEW